MDLCIHELSGKRERWIRSGYGAKFQREREPILFFGSHHFDIGDTSRILWTRRKVNYRYPITLQQQNSFLFIRKRLSSILFDKFWKYATTIYIQIDDITASVIFKISLAMEERLYIKERPRSGIAIETLRSYKQQWGRLDSIAIQSCWFKLMSRCCGTYKMSSHQISWRFTRSVKSFQVQCNAAEHKSKMDYVRSVSCGMGSSA